MNTKGKRPEIAQYRTLFPVFQKRGTGFFLSKPKNATTSDLPILYHKLPRLVNTNLKNLQNSHILTNTPKHRQPKKGKRVS